MFSVLPIDDQTAAGDARQPPTGPAGPGVKKIANGTTVRQLSRSGGDDGTA
jgi:hypothetical protein